MILSTEETWATDTLRDGQDPGAGTQRWRPLSKLTLERYNLIFAQAHSRGYAADGQPEHDAGVVLENSQTTLFKCALVSGDLLLTKWSVGNDPEAGIDDAVIVADAALSDTARPSLELVAGVNTTVRVFYVGEGDANIHYIESVDSGDNFGAEQAVGALTAAKAIASVSMTKVHCISYASGNTRFHVYEDDAGWAVTDSLIYWPHEIDFIDAITIGSRDLVVFYSLGPVYGVYREAGVYGIWYKNGRWSDIFKIDVVGEATTYSYRQHPMISTANSIYFITLVASEGDSQYSQALRALKTSKDGRYWSQYQPLVTCTELGPAKLLTVDAETDATWPWSDGLQTYVVGYDKIYESDSTRLVGEDNTDLQVDLTSRTTEWRLSRGVIGMASALVANHDGGLDAHAIINADNTLLLKREAGYYTGVGAEYAELSLEQVDFFKETDDLPRRHKQMVSRDLMAWMRDKEAKHYEELASQLIGYDNYDDSGVTGRGGLSHTITKKGRWETQSNILWLKSDNEEGVAFASWGSHLMNGQVKAMIRIETEGNNEYSGVVFRGLDEGNFWSAYYDQATDKIVLRQKVGGEWQVAVATSAALTWADDTWYGIMVDFRYSYIRVYYSADGLTWTAALTHTIIPNPALPGSEYGYVGPLGYGYSDQDTDFPPGYTPPVLPPPTTAPGSGAEGDGNKLYFPEYSAGHLWFTANARHTDPTAVVYVDKGLIGTNPRFLILDPFNPKNSAMVVCDHAVYRTDDLDSAVPTWTLKLDLSAPSYAWHGAASICQDGLWVVSGYWNNVGLGEWHPRGWVSIDHGANWTAFWYTTPTEGKWSKIELSSHKASDAYAMVYNTVGGLVRAGTSANINGGAPTWSWTTLWTGASDPPVVNPYHRYFQNDDDQHALWAGEQGNAPVQSQSAICTADQGTCTKTALDATGVVWCGGETWGTQSYWVVTEGDFYVSEDGIAWIARGVIHPFVSGWPRDGRRFYATNNGAVHPLEISNDWGLTWQAQTGNWAADGAGAGSIIPNCVPMWLE